MLEDAHQQEPIFDFQRMYCTVCLFLQLKVCEFRNEKQSKATRFHLPRKPTGEDHKKGPKKPPKGIPKPSSEASKDTPKRSPNSVHFKNHFLRRPLPGGFGVCLPWDLEGGPRLYIDTRIFARAKILPWNMTFFDDYRATFPAACLDMLRSPTNAGCLTDANPSTPGRKEQNCVHKDA